MSERQRFLAEVASGEESFSAVCRRYEISRKTGYKWLHRAEAGESLENLSKKPFHSPKRTPPEIEKLVLDERDQHPAWGPRKLKQALANKGHEDIPCKSTIENILKRNDRIEPEASEASTPFKRFEHASPNDLWQMDFKGDFGMLDGQRCYPLTILDDHSRFSLCLHASAGTNYAEFCPVFTEVLKEYGLPKTILCDNGKPWGDSHGGITSFEVWMMKLGVLPIHGRPLHPQTQGKEERFHRTLKRELLSARPIRDQTDAQAAFDRWRQEYNCERPHEALQLDVPEKYYRSSTRLFDGTVKPVEYDEGARLRKVNCKGYLSFQRHRYYFSEALIGEYIELVDVDEALISLRYGDFEIAQINLREGRIVSKRKQRVR